MVEKIINDEELYDALTDFPSYSQSDGTLEIKKTWLETFLLYNKNSTIEWIANERNLTKETIAKHLTILVKMKVIKDFSNIIEEKDYQIILSYIQKNYESLVFHHLAFMTMTLKMHLTMDLLIYS